VEAASWQLARSDGKNQLPYQHDSDRYGGSPTWGALVFVGDAMEDLPTFTPASLACQYFCFGKGTTPGATPTFHEIARLTGAPIAGSIQAQPGSWRAPAGGSCGRPSRGRRASQDVLARSIRRPRRPSPFGNPRVCAFVVQVFHIARLASLKCDFVHAKRHCLDLLHIWRKSP
jgi:hypothetical protein